MTTYEGIFTTLQGDHMLTKWETSDRKFFLTSPFIRFIDSLEEKSGLLT